MLSPRERSSNPLKAKKFWLWGRYPKGGTNSGKFGLSGRRHLPGSHGNPGHFYQQTGGKGFLDTQEHSTTRQAWPQTKLENQQGQKIASTGITVPGKGTTREKRQQSWV